MSIAIHIMALIEQLARELCRVVRVSLQKRLASLSNNGDKTNKFHGAEGVAAKEKNNKDIRA